MFGLRKVRKDAAQFWVRNQPKILFLLVVTVAVEFSRRLPYLNVFLSFSLIGIFLWIITLLLFNAKGHFSLIAAFLFLLTTSLTVAIQKMEIAQEAASLAYYLELAAFIQMLLERRYAKRRDR